METGNISVKTENIFPLIREFLYTDKEIFLRELIANAIDATTKLKSLALSNALGTALNFDNLFIKVTADTNQGILIIRDAGIGMTYNDVIQYLTEVALSSAQKFMENFASSDAPVIGHFGLGFYSAFMVADKVEVFSQSYKKGEQGVHWISTGTSYTINHTTDLPRGTEIRLHIKDDCKEFLEGNKVFGLLQKYCSFLPFPIHCGIIRTEEEIDTGITDANGNIIYEIQETSIPRIVNPTEPIWTIPNSDLSDEAYRSFFHHLYPSQQKDPLFWMPIKMTYPIKLSGILYLPALDSESSVMESLNNISSMHIYCNQMYVTNRTEGLLPEFLSAFYGIIDSPDLPLNVSRSDFQFTERLKALSANLIDVFTTQLIKVFEEDRARYERIWSKVGVFFKYGIGQNVEFAERILGHAMLQNTANRWFTIQEFATHQMQLHPESVVNGKIIFLYADQPKKQTTHIRRVQKHGYSVLLFETMIDLYFLEYLKRVINDVTFIKIDDASVTSILKIASNEEDLEYNPTFVEFKKAFEKVIHQPNFTPMITLQALDESDWPILITQTSETAKMNELSANYGFDNNFYYCNVLINTSHWAIKALLNHFDKDKASYLFQVAMVQQGVLSGSDLETFFRRSIEFSMKDYTTIHPS